ncbi:hypothetical protein CsSME_00032962 [Camellia sinensis var. sinensis]
MHEITEFTDNRNSSEQDGEAGTMPKNDILDLPPDKIHSRHIGDNVASSSGTNLRSSFIGMGFSQSLVDKVIEEKGEDDVDLLLETLFAYSALQKPQSESSDSLDGLFCDKKDEIAADSHPKEVLHKQNSKSSDSLESLFGDDKDTSCSPNIAGEMCPKEETDIHNAVNDDRRASLLMMNFSLDEINFAMEKLGEDAPVNELVDFIFAAQVSEHQAHDKDNTCHGNEERNKEASKLITDKTLRLLEMGFSENQISAAIEKYGSEVPISKLANSICADEIGGACNVKNKHPLTSFNKKFSNTGINYRSWARGVEDDPSNNSLDPLTLKTKEFSRIAVSRYKDLDLEKHKGKRPREEYLELSSLKRPKQERAPVPQGQLGNKPRRIDGLGMPTLSKPKSCQSVDKMVAKAPYFFYGNVMNLSQDCWVKISQFLYAIEPEFVNSQFFSALSRKEGYIHNLPSQNRFHITPKPPMTIEAAIPHTKKWWPLWDPRKQLSCITFEINGVSELCDRLGKILTDSKGILSAEKQRDLLHQCRALNLVWVGRHKLAPVEPEHLERILGYPLNHTRDSELSLKERLQSLKHSFQIDTLGYHLSVLKSLYPGGLTVLSIYSGIGGAEISLHRLGIRLKGVVSIEPCERKRKILKKWWQSTGQTGELVQIEGIQRLASNKLESLIKQFGGFDFIICQNPYTYSSKIPTMAADGDSVGDLDFSLFYEFVRVLQRVRSTMERSK